MATLNQMKIDFSREYKDLRVDMRSSYITSTPYVIEISELYVSPIFKDGKTTGKVKLDGCPLRVTRFSRVDAENLAVTVMNGAGERGKAVSVYDAVRTRHGHVRSVLHVLRSYAE